MHVFKYAFWILLVGILVGLVSVLYGGASAGSFDPTTINTGDTAWVLTAAALVLIMTPGVGLFYGGMVRSKNVVSVLKQSIVITALVSIQWIIFGYTLAFGKDIQGFLGDFSFFALRGVGFSPNSDYAGTIPHLVYMIFQAKFAIITPALIIGAFVERIRFRTLLLFIFLWSTFIYDPVAHWVWGVGGWLRNLGALDFAGGTVVHITAGLSALAAAMVIGRRTGIKPGQLVPASNVPLVILGGTFLWFGWFGFNAGSALSASPLAASAFVVTNTAAAASALTWMLLSYFENKKPSAMATITGAIAGLVAITPASGFVGPVASISIGIIAGVLTYLTLYVRMKHTSIDDSLDVFACHGVGGITGAILTGIFAEKAINAAGNNGLLFGNPAQLWTQVVAVVVTAVYAFVGTYIILKILEPIVGLRVSKRDEEEGLDLATHGEAGYRL
ncbi:ammonium transporter [Candidatus Gottesmanbacteria bacterium]|nr:ammonium transporter [Candidatus Gottesmanbacteria bacterium]